MDRNKLRECSRLMAGGSKSFFAASRVLPGRVREPATALYAFCRVADDAIDHSDTPMLALLELSQRLDDIYAGRPQAPVCDHALAHVVHTYQLPRALPDALLEGFAWDAEGRRYETIEQLHDYGARVAGTVGAMMAVVMEARDRPTAGTRLRTGRGDAADQHRPRRGRGRTQRAPVPAARQWMREAGLDPDAWLADPRFDAALAGVIERLLAEADRLYQRAECGVASLPRDCRLGIQAARLVYGEIGQRLRQSGLDSVSRRAVVGRSRKLALIARASIATVFAPGHPLDLARDPDPQAAIRHLVDAAACDELPSRTFYQRTLRMLDLFERVGQRQRRLA
jgi:phytoene synthase